MASTTAPRLAQSSGSVPRNVAFLLRWRGTLQRLRYAKGSSMSAVKTLPTVSLLTIGATVDAGTGSGKVVDVTVRAQDGLMVVRVERHESPPGCAVWYHTFGKKLDGQLSSALLAQLLTAQASGKTVRVAGTGACLPGTGTEEIVEINLGPWGN